MSFKIQDIKSALVAGGARSNLFHVSMQLPSSIDLDGTIAPGASKDAFARKISFLCNGTSLPSDTIGTIAVPYQGREIHVASSRKFDSTWGINIINDEDFLLKKCFENWINAINHSTNNIRNSGATASSESYKTDATIKVYGKSDDENPIRKVKLIGLFPTIVNTNELAWTSAENLMETKITFSFDLHQPDGSAD